MIIAGSGGFSKEVLEVLIKQNYPIENIAFFDNISSNLPQLRYNLFPILQSQDDIKKFTSSKLNEFCLGVGNPTNRYKIMNLLLNYECNLVTLVSSDANIGSFNTIIGKGCTIMPGCIITNDIKIGMGCLINLNCTIGHDSILGDFVELSPGVHVSGNCQIGDYSVLGTNSTIIPGIKIGRNVIVAAGSVITMDIPDSVMVAGVPAQIKKHL